jgi:hypothetical protein
MTVSASCRDSELQPSLGFALVAYVCDLFLGNRTWLRILRLLQSWFLAMAMIWIWSLRFGIGVDFWNISVAHADKFGSIWVLFNDPVGSC